MLHFSIGKLFCQRTREVNRAEDVVVVGALLEWTDSIGLLTTEWFLESSGGIWVQASISEEQDNLSA